MPAKNKKLPPRDSAGRFTAKPAPVGAAPSSDTADSLRVVTQGLSALLTQIKIDRQNARRRVLTPKEKDLRRDRANAALPDLRTEIKDLTDTLKEFESVEKYKKYIEEQKVKAKAEKDKTKYQDAAEREFESGNFISGIVFKWLGRNEPKKGDLKKEEEEKHLDTERRKLNKTLLGLQEREANLQRLAGVIPTPTPIAPEAPAATAEAAKPEVQILEEEARVKAEQIHTETQKQTTIIQRTSDGIDKLWTEPIKVNATVTDLSDPALKKLVTKLKDEGIGTGGGGGLGDLLGGLGGAAAGKGASKGGGSFLSKVSKVGKTAPIIGGVLTAGLGLMQGDSVAKAGSKGVGTTVGSIAGAALGASLGPVGMYVGGLIGGILGDVLGGLFGDFLNNLGNIFTMKSGDPTPPGSPQNNTIKESDLTNLKMKRDSGSEAMAPGRTISSNTKDTATAIQDKISGFNQITSLNDTYHVTGAHAMGNAIDFTLDKPPTREEAKAIVKQLEEMPNVKKVIDEYNNPSAGSTGGHFHVEVNPPKAEDTTPPVPAKSAGTPAASHAPTKQNVRSTGISPTPSPDLEDLQNMNGISNAQGIINENKKWDDAITMTASHSKFPATASAPSFVTDSGPQNAKPLYSNSIQTDIIKDQAQAKQVQSVVVLQDNSSKSSTTSSQKEARDHFLPIPNYFQGYFSP